MIDYVEIRDSDKNIIAIIDDFKSVIWDRLYYKTGEFEIYTVANQRNVQLLQPGRYVTRCGVKDLGIIERIDVKYDIIDGLMITASGRFAKSILDRRLIYNLSGYSNQATILKGNVEKAVRTVVSDNAINCSFDSKRNVPDLQLGELANISDIIVNENNNAAEKQVSYENLLEYTDEVLQEYNIGARIDFDNDTKKLNYVIWKGADRSISNTEGNHPVIFSQEFDNLMSSEYTYNSIYEKNVALIGGAGEGIDRFYSLIGSSSGLDRKEEWVNASSLSKKYKDGETEKTYTDAEYKNMLDTKGRQDIARMTVEESFTGVIDVTSSQYVYGEDYFLGDVVTVQDNNINKIVNVRITEVTEVCDEHGYNVNVIYE